MAEDKVKLTEHMFEPGTSIEDDFCYRNNVAKAHVYIRMGFIRKVYGILSVQLLCTSIVSLGVMMSPAAKLFIMQNNWLVTLSLFGSLGLLLGLMVKRRDYPTNFYLLAAFTLSQSLSVAAVVSFYDTMSVLLAFVLTLSVTGGLTAYTFQTKRDFTMLGASLFTCLWVLILGGLMNMVLPITQMEWILSVGGALLFSLFIVFDTHMMMHRLSPEEYIIATVELYMDIINLFLHILRIVGEARK